MTSSRQDGRLVWNGLLALPVDQAASLLALLDETTFANVMGKKVKSIFRKEDEFAQALQQRTEELSRIDHPALLLRLLGKLEAIADVDPGYLASRRDYEDLCGELASRAVALKREGNRDFEGTSLLDLVGFVMREMFEGIEDNFEKLSGDAQDKIVGELSKFLANLPENHQKVFCESAGIDAITEDTIRQAIITGTIGIAFSTLVSVVGFAFYTTAASMLASLAGLVGLTLPFAAYIGLSSWIAVLADPITIMLVLSAIFAAGWWKGDQKVQQTLYPLAIVQLVALVSSDKFLKDRSQLEARVLAAWREAISAYLNTQEKLETLREQRQICQNNLKKEQELEKELRQRRDGIETEISSSWNEIRNFAFEKANSVAAGQWGAAYKKIAKEILTAKKELDESTRPSEKEGIFDRVAEPIARGYDNWKASSALDEALDKLISALKPDLDSLFINDADVKPVLTHLRSMIGQICSESKKQAANEERIKNYKQNFAELDEQISSMRSELKDLEEEYFGIRKAATDWPDVASVAGPPVDRDGRLLMALDQPLVPQAEEERLRRLLSGGRGDSAFAGLVVGDFLYDYLRIDPVVMEGVDFARAADLSNPLAFAEFANKQATLMAEGAGDSIDRLKGYVAERMVAQHVAAAGYDVSFPESPNQVGYDLLINGQPFQVKCTESAGYLRDHLEKYSDITVIVNAEHAAEFANVPGVYVDPALSVTEVTALTEEGISHGAELLDFELPWIALAVSAAVELRDLYHSRTGLTNSAINVATDTAGRTLLGSFGAKAGGVMAAVIFGPAGSVVGSLGGAIAGGIGGGHLAKLGRAFLVSDESESARKAARDLASSAAAAVPEKLTVWQAKRRKVLELVIADSEHRHEVEQIKDWLEQQMDNDARYFHQRQRELEQIANGTDNANPYELAKRVLDLIGRAGIHPHRLQGELEKMFAAFKKLGEAIARYRIGESGTGDSAA
jgi:hypothetical protein